MAVTLSAGGSLSWWRSGSTPTSRPGGRGRRRRAGGRGPAVPAVPDRRAEPVPRPARARRFVGLTLRHTRAPTRAVLEGVVFSMRDGLEVMRGSARPTTTCARPRGRRTVAAVDGAAGRHLRSRGAADGGRRGPRLRRGAAGGRGGRRVRRRRARRAARCGCVRRSRSPTQRAARYDELYAVYRTLYRAARPDARARAPRFGLTVGRIPPRLIRFARAHRSSSPPSFWRSSRLRWGGGAAAVPIASGARRSRRSHAPRPSPRRRSPTRVAAPGGSRRRSCSPAAAAGGWASRSRAWAPDPRRQRQTSLLLRQRRQGDARAGGGAGGPGSRPDCRGAGPLRPMITVSDNAAASTVYARVGSMRCTGRARRGMTHFDVGLNWADAL